MCCLLEDVCPAPRKADPGLEMPPRGPHPRLREGQWRPVARWFLGSAAHPRGQDEPLEAPAVRGLPGTRLGVWVCPWAPEDQPPQGPRAPLRPGRAKVGAEAHGKVSPIQGGHPQLGCRIPELGAISKIMCPLHLVNRNIGKLRPQERNKDEE